MISYQISRSTPNSSDRHRKDAGCATFLGSSRTTNLRATDADDYNVPFADTNPLRPNDLTIHIIDHDAFRRARVARMAFVAGFHAEIYAGCEEFVKCTQRGGVIFCYVEPDTSTISDLNSLMAVRGDWLPTIAFSESLDTKCIVAAIRMGAVNFLQYPFDVTPFLESIDSTISAAEKIAKARSLEAESTLRVNRLSERERQVLASIASGNSNKVVARDLDISPRTVEIHRMKMMGKLGAKHVADAVRMWIVADGVERAKN